MVKARTPDKEHLLANLQQRIYHIEQFVTARLNAKDDPAAMVRICHALLEQQDVESALRVSGGRTCWRAPWPNPNRHGRGNQT